MLKKLIDKLGNSFRGLWTGVIIQDSYGKIVKKKDWTVTFVFEGDYVETPGFDTPEEALNYAVTMLSEHEPKVCITSWRPLTIEDCTIQGKDKIKE